jgi:hypothetical protein
LLHFTNIIKIIIVRYDKPAEAVENIIKAAEQANSGMHLEWTKKETVSKGTSSLISLFVTFLFTL